MSLRSKGFIHKILPAKGWTRFLLLRPSSDFQSPLQFNYQVAEINSETKYDFIIDPKKTRNKTRPVFLDGQDARIQFELEIALRHMRHETKEQLFWLRPLCVNEKNSVERDWHYRCMFDIVQHANRVRAFMGKPHKRADPENIAKVLQAMHDLVGETSERQPPKIKTKENLLVYYGPLAPLLSQPDADAGLTQAIELICSSMWKENWSFLQKAGVMKEIDCYVGSTSIPIDHFYMLTDFLCRAKRLHCWPEWRPPVGAQQILPAACRISDSRKQVLRLLKTWSSRIVKDGPLPERLMDDLDMVIDPEFYYRKQQRLKKRALEEENAQMEGSQEEGSHDTTTDPLESFVDPDSSFKKSRLENHTQEEGPLDKVSKSLRNAGFRYAPIRRLQHTPFPHDEGPDQR